MKKRSPAEGHEAVTVRKSTRRRYSSSSRQEDDGGDDNAVMRNDDPRQGLLQSVATASDTLLVSRNSQSNTEERLPWTASEMPASAASSLLFASPPPSRLSASALSSSVLAPATLWGRQNNDSTTMHTSDGGLTASSAGDNNENMPSPAKRPPPPPHLGSAQTSSLFGAVMRQSRSSSGHKSAPTLSNAAAAAVGGAMLPPPPPPMTPQQQQPINRTVLTPSGFGLLNTMDGWGSSNSPFLSKMLLHTPQQQSNSSSDDVARQPPRQTVEWRDAVLNETEPQLLDWTLFHKLQWDAHPGFAGLPPITASSALAVDAFAQNMQNSQQQQQSPHRQWQQALLYWEFSCAKMSVAAGLAAKNKQVARKEPSTVDDSSTTTTAGQAPTQVLFDYMQQHQSAGARKRQVMHQMRRDWQEAFQSLFGNYMDKVRGGDGNNVVSNQHCFFYAQSKSHTVLFRRVEDDGDANVPEIVVSASSRSFRNAMRKLGAQWQLLHQWKGLAALQPVEEADLTVRLSAAGSTSTSKTALSPATKAELDALRKAQVTKQTAGAEIGVKIKTTTAAPARRSMNVSCHVPPLVVRGWDDCAAFAEVYLNVCGDVMNSGHNEPHLPVLRCRHLGPFRHAMVQCLYPVYKRDASADSDATSNLVTAIEITGPILPCATRELIGAAARLMKVDTTEERPELTLKSHDNGGGTHFIVRASRSADTTDESASSTVPGDVGTDQGLSFNADPAVAMETNDRDWQKCHYGESLAMAIYDDSRPKSLAYKFHFADVGPP